MLVNNNIPEIESTLCLYGPYVLVVVELIEGYFS